MHFIAQTLLLVYFISPNTFGHSILQQVQTFCLRRLFPNKNFMLTMYNTPFHSSRFPLSILFGIFRFELIVHNFRAQNYGVSS
jgi:hypothetical protein